MLAVKNVSLRFGDRTLFKDVSLQFLDGCRYGLVGANGAGKTSFLKILSGEMSAGGGEIAIPNKSRIGTLKQDQFLYDNEPILEVVMRGEEISWNAHTKKNALLEKETLTDKEIHQLSDLEELIEYGAESRAGKLLEGLGLQGNVHLNPLSSLSGGYKLRVLLAKLLFGKPEILILDEPTNHLDLFSIKWLEGYLREFEGILVVCSHDKDFLNSVCTHIADVDYGTIKIYKGNLDDCIKKKEEETALKGNVVQSFEKKQEKLQEFVDRFGAKASKASQAQMREKMIVKLEEEKEKSVMLPTSRATPTLSFEICRPSGQIPLVVNGVSKTFGTKKVLENISFEVERGERIAILGPNGIGKSTLLEILTGGHEPDNGEFKWGFETHVSYFPQNMPKDMKKNETPLDYLFNLGLPEQKLRSMLGRVLFKKDDASHKKIEALSGGEVSRLVLARMMLQKQNVLILDEPTNHLDMESIDELIKSLVDYKGTLIFVSHNCYFVSKLATRIFEITASGIKDFKGPYDEYVAASGRDYLSSSNAMRLRFSNQFQHGAVEKANKANDYEARKAAKKQAKKLEERCYKLEESVKALNAALHTETAPAKLRDLMKEKEGVEKELEIAMKEWELLA